MSVPEEDYEYEDKEFVAPPCVHCGAPVLDYYMVQDRLWCLATAEGPERDGQMHWECLKTRLAPLGHTLSPESLTNAPVNERFRKELGNLPLQLEWLERWIVRNPDTDRVLSARWFETQEEALEAAGGVFEVLRIVIDVKGYRL